MSKPLDLSKPLTQAQIDELLAKHPNEKVQYWVEVSNAAAFDENLEKGDYDKLTVNDLVDELDKRGLPHSGNKSDLVAALEEDDEKRSGSGESE